MDEHAQRAAVRFIVSLDRSVDADSFNDDDAFDWDEGYRGKLQFLFTIQDPAVGNHAFESDGGTTPEDGQPYAMPTIYNYTAIGSGATSGGH